MIRECRDHECIQLRYYRGDIYGRATYILHLCELEIANHLAAVVATRFRKKSGVDSTSD